jgi:hypothetical protein
MSNELILKDFEVKVKVLGRTVHKFIVRAINEDYALVAAKDIVIHSQELTDEECEYAEYYCKPFDLTYLLNQVYICF